MPDAMYPDPCLAETPEPSSCPAEAVPNRSDLEAKCEQIINNSDVLSLLSERLRDCGFVGDTGHGELIYLALNTRFFERLCSVVIKGNSSGGKSYLVNTVLKFVPASAYEDLSGMSEKALIYWDAYLRHKHLVIQERAGLGGDRGHPFLRMLLSEGRLCYVVTERDGNGPYGTREITKEGPTGLLTTTTQTMMNSEDESRLLSVQIDESQEQLRRVLIAQAAEAAGDESYRDVDLEAWHWFGEWLALGPHKVLVPFATRIAKALPATSLRLKRDFPQLLALIKAHALIHQANRECDCAGNIIANLDDYAAVAPRLDGVFARAAQSELPQRIVNTYHAVCELQHANDNCPVSITDIARHMGVSMSTASRNVGDACALGYLKNFSRSGGYEGQVVIAKPLPIDETYLPTVEELLAPIT